MIKTAFEVKTVGRLLTEKREEKKLNFEQVAEIIKINPDYLQALEKGEYDKFPAEVYIKGFLKNYAKFLGVNPEKALALYRRERERKTELNNLDNRRFSKEKILSGFTLTPVKIAALFFLVVIFSGLIYLGQNISTIFREPELTLTQPLELTAGESGSLQTTDPELVLQGTAEIGSDLTINGEAYETNSFEQFRVNLDLNALATDTITIKAVNEFNREAVIRLNLNYIVPTPTPIPAAEGEASEATNDINAEIEVINRGAYLEITADGSLIAARAYENGEVINVNAESELEIFAPAYENIILKINNELRPLSEVRSKFIFSEGQVSPVNL